MKRKTRVAAAICAALVLGGVCLPLTASAEKISTWERDIPDIRCSAYERISVRVKDRAVGGYLIDGTTYIALRAFAEAQGVTGISYDAATRTATVKATGLALSVRDGEHLLRVNGRCFYMDMPARILGDGSFYLPVRPLARAFGASVEWNAASRSVRVGGKTTFPESGDSYYDAGTLYWLSRIISAESRGEPFLGQVAVGNVILNRVRDPAYPDSVYGVIFDRKYGTQFTPSVNGTIYNTPTASAVEAAKVCLEGYSVSEKILYFYEPAIAVSSWIGKNRPYAFRIGAHYFYY